MRTGTIQSSQPYRTQKLRRPAARQPWLWLALGAALLLFANGRSSIPLAAWLAPVFLLRFVRLQPRRIWMPTLYIVGIATHAFAFRGMIPIPGIFYYIFLAAAGLLALVPFLADRWLAPRLPAFAAALVFPCVWVALDFAISFGLHGTWGNAAYSQYGDLPLLQIVSVTGLWGIVFLLGWFAATCNWLWEKGLADRGARAGALLCLGTIAVVLLLGGARLAFFPPSSAAVRVASLSTRPLGIKLPEYIGSRIYAGNATPADVPLARQWDAAVQNDLLARSEREAQAGAKIIFWTEGSAPVWKNDEPAFLARGSELASKYKIYLGMALGVWS
ncbi:MAG: nitrilase-related carbon-nitrogen hydrolase, partial [Bryobacteraceae bacterium]